MIVELIPPARRQRFQFGLGAVMVAVLFTAIGVSILLRAQGSFLWFAMMTALAGGSFGAAAGTIFRRARRFAAVGLALGILFALYAAAA